MKNKHHYWIGFEWENENNPRFQGTYDQCVVYLRNHYPNTDIEDVPDIINYETGRAMSFIL